MARKKDVRVRLSRGSVIIQKQEYTPESGVFTIDAEIAESVMKTMDGSALLEYEVVDGKPEDVSANPGAI